MPGNAHPISTPYQAGRGSLAVVLAIVAAGLACASGCVERRMTICSNPPGALVYIDDYEIGVTPVSTSFVYYGDRKFRLVKDGCETLTTIQTIPTPPYEYWGADFIAENLVPGKIRDERTFVFTLQPQTMVPPDQLRARGEELRRGTQAALMGSGQPIIPAVRVNTPQAAYPGPTPAAGPGGVGGQVPYPVQPGM